MIGTGKPRRSHCEACGQVPANAVDLRLRWVRTTGAAIALCVECWDQVLHGRSFAVTVDALMEELADHRFKAPQRAWAGAPLAPWQGTTRTAGMGRQQRG